MRSRLAMSRKTVFENMRTGFSRLEPLNEPYPVKRPEIVRFQIP